MKAKDIDLKGISKIIKKNKKRWKVIRRLNKIFVTNIPNIPSREAREEMNGFTIE